MSALYARRLRRIGCIAGVYGAIDAALWLYSDNLFIGRLAGGMLLTAFVALLVAYAGSSE